MPRGKDVFPPGVIKSETNKTDSKKRTRRDRDHYLNASADILCKQAYKMCRATFGAKGGAADSKSIKEACSALKEAAALSAALQKAPSTGEALRIEFSGAAEDYSI